MRKFNLRLKALTVAGVLSSAFFTVNATAGAFQLWEQDVSGMGDYHAGAAAEGDTAGSEFYNPASITRLKHPQVSLGAALVAINLKYTGSMGAVTRTQIPGGTTNIVPNFHLVMPLSSRWFFSLGTAVPFGLETKYPDTLPDGSENTAATKTKLQTINLNPSVAYKLSRCLSLAVGLDVLYGSADYDEEVFAPLTTELTGWSTGYNAGALVQLPDHTRVGLSYRSGITIDAKGKSTWLGTSQNSSAKFPLPSTTILSVLHQFSSRFTLMASAFYTNWSVFKELVLKNVGPNAITTIGENYRNTWNFALGGKYRVNSHLSVEAGVGHDDTPTRVGYRDIRLPDNSRYVASVGVNITPKPGLVWSIGYTHLFLPNTTVDNSLSPSYTGKVTTVGTATGDINLIGMQISCDI